MPSKKTDQDSSQSKSFTKIGSDRPMPVQALVKEDVEEARKRQAQQQDDFGVPVWEDTGEPVTEEELRQLDSDIRDHYVFTVGFVIGGLVVAGIWVLTAAVGGG